MKEINFLKNVIIMKQQIFIKKESVLLKNKIQYKLNKF